MKRKTKRRFMKKWKEGGEHISNFNTIIETDNKEDLNFVDFREISRETL